MPAARWARLWPHGIAHKANPRVADPTRLDASRRCSARNFPTTKLKRCLRSHDAVFQKLEKDALLDFTVELLKTEKVVGWFQGRMEFGPRALGNRSILGDARSAKMQSVMNLKVKFRESFRPFAPIVRRERVADYFELDAESPYMLLVAPVKKELRREVSPEIKGLDRLKETRSTLPAITHVDYSARIQTVERDGNPLLYDLLLRFEQATGCGVLVNTSFNVRGEPIVCTPGRRLSLFHEHGDGFSHHGQFCHRTRRATAAKNFAAHFAAGRLK